MRRLWLLLTVLLLPAVAGAQGIDYRPAGSTGTGSADPSQFSSAAGTLTIGGSVGAVTLDADTTIVPLYSTGTSDPATCTQGGMFHYRTDSSLLKICKATNTWTPIVTDDRLTDCQDTGGNHLNYNSSTGAFSCGTSGGSSFDPGTTVEIYDDFLNGNSTTGQIGSAGWRFTAASTGTLDSDVADSASHPGLVRLKSHATNDNSGVNLYLSGAASNAFGTGWFSREWSLDFNVIVGSNSTAITSVGFYVGLMRSPHTAIPSAAADGLWVRFDTDYSDTTFMFQSCYENVSGCASASDSTYTKVMASTVTPSAGTAYRFRIRRVASGVGGNPTIYFRVNSETEKTMCSSGCDKPDTMLPNDAVVPFISYVTRTTTGVISGDADYASITITGLTRN